MSVINSSSAVIAKARAKYGRRLTEKDYGAMVRCATVGEIVQYLKMYTSYQTFLDKVSNQIHRGNLENILRKELFNAYLSLCRYAKRSSPISSYLIRRSEIRELMKFITLLSIGKPEEYIFAAPLYLSDHTELDLQNISKVRTHEELLSLLGHSDYRAIVAEYRPDESNAYPIADLEDALECDSISRLYRDIHAVKSKKDRAQMTALLDTLCDYQNYSRIMRLKKYYHMNNGMVRDHLLPFGALTGKRLDSILSNESYEEVRAALIDGTKFGRYARRIDISREMAVQGKYDLCRRQLYFSDNPDIVLLAYYVVTETELHNVITIVEGVRYSMAPQNIYEMLIL